MPTITATDLARHTRHVLDQVVRGGQVVTIERNHAPVARLVPATPHMTAAQALADLPVTLTRAQATQWLQDSRGDFDDAVRSPWA
ncbi:type II toxin-antitoxin system Phd/YefM family antitoxin [Ralstonia pseudosolanacearum]|uniref:type II toxin-antitoxin system Phd/YefM family antitoxin n=1 Tax=Ralstonia pseudosolanacearum TaxID=1310165 RepID=UPI002700057E|nr:type II toxin-antitoxin system Phd/YefM family antitoxin [Ralstonia pseudosolanacearum]MDO3615309.1 type II toxin-antitoxin system Phd/YefM family antitoxin [Ralstonia pseudosolanacearum]